MDVRRLNSKSTVSDHCRQVAAAAAAAADKNCIDVTWDAADDRLTQSAGVTGWLALICATVSAADR